MEQNKPALKTLSVLLIVVALIFSIEKKFLVRELRGESISKYESIKWVDQVALLIDDFEGLTDTTSLKNASFFGYGNAHISIDSTKNDKNTIASKNCVKVQWGGAYNYGGWGKGVGKNVELNTAKDHFNFRVFVPKTNADTTILKLMLEEDDNFNGTLDTDKDDSWFYKIPLYSTGKWEMVSIPLKDFTDNNPDAGDGILNISRKSGLHTVIIAFENVERFTPEHKWYFDFICFTKEKISE